MITEKIIQESYPLHWSIWNNDLQGLKEGLASGFVSINVYCLRMSLSLSNLEVMSIFLINFVVPLVSKCYLGLNLQKVIYFSALEVHLF